MATITNGYTDLPTLKGRLGIDQTDTTLDTRLEAAVNAASRRIDSYCGGRFFFQATQTRYFTSPQTQPFLIDGRIMAGPECWIDDVVTVTQVATDFDGDGVFETVWDTTDYWLLPYNAPNESPAQPYHKIQITPYGKQAFPAIPRGVQVIGTFGWPAIPPEVTEACLREATRIYRLGDAPFGVMGSGEFGTSVVTPSAPSDPLVRALIDPYRRIVAG